MWKINCFDGDKMMSSNKKPPDGYKEGPLPVISGESKSILKRKSIMKKYDKERIFFVGEPRSN